MSQYVCGARRTDEDAIPRAARARGRFPQWMWRNADVLNFVGWLREWERGARPEQAHAVRVYGLDLYSLQRSIELRAAATCAPSIPTPERRARSRYACFEHFGDDPQAYGHAALPSA